MNPILLFLISLFLIFSYELQLQARDTKSISSFKTLVVQLQDVNDNIPQFTLSVYETAVPEGRPADTPVVVVEAIDKDVTPEFRQVGLSFRTSCDKLLLC